MINDLKKDSEQRMMKTLESLEQGFNKVRTGRAHPSILNGVMVPYYGSDVPLNQVANVGLKILVRLSFNHLNVQWFLQLIKQFVKVI